MVTDSMPRTEVVIWDLGIWDLSANGLTKLPIVNDDKVTEKCCVSVTLPSGNTYVSDIFLIIDPKPDYKNNSISFS